MLSNLLQGWEVKVQWSDGEIETFWVVDKVTNSSLNQISYNSDLVKELLNSNIGEERSYFSNGVENKFTLLEMNNNNIKDVIVNHKLTKLYHYTSTDNLLSILKHGILSKDQLIKRNISFSKNDNLRLDNLTDYISCSLEYPNNKLLFRNRCHLNKVYCLIEIDVEVLNYTFSICSPTNASTNAGKNIMSSSFIDRLFYPPRPEELPINFTTDEQAEILIKNSIPANFIRSVIFEDLFAYSKFRRICPKNIKVLLNRNLFLTRDIFLN